MIPLDKAVETVKENPTPKMEGTDIVVTNREIYRWYLSYLLPYLRGVQHRDCCGDVLRTLM